MQFSLVAQEQGLTRTRVSFRYINKSKYMPQLDITAVSVLTLNKNQDVVIGRLKLSAASSTVCLPALSCCSVLD